MSQANVEIVKRATDAFNRRDVDVFDDLTTSDFEWFPAMDRLVEAGSYRGRVHRLNEFVFVTGTAVRTMQLVQLF
jgi:ketosteroid isomerase-like protein